MDLKSCLYTTTIMHHRLSPTEHRFDYRFFSFYLDLDELDVLNEQVPSFSRNRFNLYSFFDRDHILRQGLSIKESVHAYLKENGIDLSGGRIMLLTYLRTMGYVFNPVSFFYCFDQHGHPVCVVAEIGNTFGEQKYFLMKYDDFQKEAFRADRDKHYYISPFTHLDDQLNFKLAIPSDKLNIRIDTAKPNQDKVVLTSMLGDRLDLTDKNLWALTLQIPLVTLKAIFLIHWHALLLWMKKVPHQEKTANMHLQKGVYRVSR